MAVYSAFRVEDVLELLGETGKVFLGHQSGLVELEQADAHPEDDLGTLVEDEVPDAKDGLSGQYLCVDADEPLSYVPKAKIYRRRQVNLLMQFHTRKLLPDVNRKSTET